MAKDLRLFIACPLPAALAEDLRHMAAAFRGKLPGARFTQPQGWHITLAFLGGTPAAKIGDISGIIDRAAQGFSAVPCSLASPGTFGPLKNAILWCGLHGAEPLGLLCASLREQLRTAALPFDQKPFAPHITLARRADLRHVDLSSVLPSGNQGMINQIVLYESKLAPGGAQYTPLFTRQLCAETPSKS